MAAGWGIDLTYTLKNNRYLQYESMYLAKKFIRKFGRKGLLLNLPIYAALLSYFYFLYRELDYVSVLLIAIGTIHLVFGFALSYRAMRKLGC